MAPDRSNNLSTHPTSELGPYRIIRTEASDPSFIALVRELDKDLAIRDGDEHAFYAQFNGLDPNTHAVLIMEGKVPVGCGAFKVIDQDAVEIKRMFVPTAHRKKGIASRVLRDLERWAGGLGYARCVLETGVKQPEAIALYQKCGYHVIPNYGPYVGAENSVCFEKRILA